MNEQPVFPAQTSRRNLIRNSLGFGVLAALFGSKANILAATTEAPAPKTATANDSYPELSRRIATLDARGGGTLELGDGVYEISQTLRLPRSVSLVMTPNAVIRAKSSFQGDAVIIKGGGDYSKYSQTAGWIRGGVIDGNRQQLTGIRVEDLHRLEIADLTVLSALQKGIHLLKGGYEANLTRVRCDVDMDTHYAPESIGIHIQRSDCKVSLAHVIGYETGVRSDAGSNWFSQVHVWNRQTSQGPMKYCFHCNGGNNSFSQCYADSPTIAGFYLTAGYQTVMQSRIYFSRWAADNTGAGFLITEKGRHGSYFGNVIFANKDHRLAKAFDGDLEGACILGTGGWGVVGGMENRIPSGSSTEHPSLNLAGKGIRLERQSSSPLPAEGELGEVRWVDDGTSSALWVKTTKGWKRSQLA